MRTEITNQFRDIISSDDSLHLNLQTRSLFDNHSKLKNHQYLIIDFYHYLITKNILSVWINFTNQELYFIAFIKNTCEIMKNREKHIVLEEFLVFMKHEEMI